MKRVTYILSLFFCFIVFAWGQEIRFFDARVNQYGHLNDVLGDQWNKIDSLVVHGHVDSLDFITMWKCALEGNLTVLNLEKAKIKNNRIPKRAFFKGKQITDEGIIYLKIRRIILPESVTEIGPIAFSRMKLERINIPRSLRKLGRSAFSNCNLLSTNPLVIPEGVEEIPSRCFVNCRGLSVIVLPSSIKRIRTSAFYDTKIKDVNFPEGLEEIGDSAFSGSELRKVVLPTTLKDVQPDAFSACPYLKEIILQEGITRIPDSFVAYCPTLEKISIPQSVSRIEDDAFSRCFNLKNIELRDGLKYIGRRAFYSCGVDSIVFPASLAYMTTETCAKLVSLKKIYSLSPIPPLCDSEYGGCATFQGGTPHDIPVYVPIGSAEKYRKAPGWLYFTNFIETDKFPMGIVSPSTTALQCNVYGKDGTIIIELPDSLSASIVYSICNINGAVIESGTLSTRLLRPMQDRGMYIVRIGNTSYKVLL